MILSAVLSGATTFVQVRDNRNREERNVPTKVQRREKLRISLHVVFYREAGFWVAHCLEMDVLGHATDKRGDLDKLGNAIAAQLDFSVRNNNHANIFMPADARFFAMYAAGKDIAEGECVLREIRRFAQETDDVTFQNAETREYPGVLTPA